MLLLLLLLAGCANVPDTYAPPTQRKPVTAPDQVPLGHFVNMNDPNAEAHLVRDISGGLEAGAWRWVRQRPELKFALTTTEHLKFSMDFAIAEATFKHTGPVTLSFFINGNLLDRVRYDSSGEKHFDKPVPAEWLRTDMTTLVAIEIDKVYVAPADGAKLGFILTRAGFVQ